MDRRADAALSEARERVLKEWKKTPEGRKEGRVRGTQAEGNMVKDLFSLISGT